MCNRHLRLQGIILLELLCVLTLSGFLLLCCAQFFLWAQESMERVNGRTTLQYHGVLALSVLRQESQWAGFMGCKEGTFLETEQIRPETALQIHSKNSSSLPTSIRQSMKAQTMVLETRHRSPETAVVMGLKQAGHQLLLDQSLSIQAGDRLIISDCAQAMEFVAQTVSNQKQHRLITTMTDLSHYAPGAQVGFYEDHYFYIAKAAYRNQRQQAVYSLFEKINQQAAQEVIPGMDDLQIRLIKKQGPDQWSLVEVSLLSDSIEAVGLKKTPYYYQGLLQWPVDEKYYQAWRGWFAIGVGA